MNKKLSMAIGATVVAAVVSCGFVPGAQAAPLPSQQTSSINIAQQSKASQAQKLARLVKAAQSSIPQINKISPGTYSSVQIKAQNPGTIVYDYKFATHVNPALVKPYFTDEVALLRRATKASVFPSMRLAGLTGTLHVVYKYRNSNGSTIWKKTFSSAK